MDMQGHRSGIRARWTVCSAAKEMKALVFDCDGVILESEDLHRVAYNAAFEVMSHLASL